MRHKVTAVCQEWGESLETTEDVTLAKDLLVDYIGDVHDRFSWMAQG